MVDSRNIPKISDRYDIVWRRWPNTLLRARRRATWLGFAAGLVLIAYPFFSGDQRMWQSRCVSPPHRLAEHRCSACHDTHWQPLLRAVTGSPRLKSVSDNACRRCHPQHSADDHHPHAIVGTDLHGCADCHQEHRGLSLLELSDSHCTHCHGELEQHRRPGAPRRVLDTIVSWGDHPEFAAKRPVSDLSALEWTFGRQAGVEADFPLPRDGTTLRFNHRLHLDPSGLPVPPEHPDFGDGKQWKVLQCADCHVLEQAGNYMLPVRYEQHCQGCHRLEFSSLLAAGSPLPHEAADIVRGVLRQRLAEYLTAHPDAARERPLVDRSLLPNTPVGEDSRPPAAAPPSDAEKWRWIEKQLADASATVREPSTWLSATSPAGLTKRIMTGCAFCHALRDAQDPRRWQVEPTRVATRYMPLARFRHAAHESQACQDCHFAGLPPRTTSVTESTTSADWLLPSREVCRKCHATSGRPPTSGSAGTRCVDCHLYHHRPESKLDVAEDD